MAAERPHQRFQPAAASDWITPVGRAAKRERDRGREGGRERGREGERPRATSDALKRSARTWKMQKESSESGDTCKGMEALHHAKQAGTAIRPLSNARRALVRSRLPWMHWAAVWHTTTTRVPVPCCCCCCRSPADSDHPSEILIISSYLSQPPGQAFHSLWKQRSQRR